MRRSTDLQCSCAEFDVHAAAHNLGYRVHTWFVADSVEYQFQCDEGDLRRQAHQAAAVALQQTLLGHEPLEEVCADTCRVLELTGIEMVMALQVYHVEAGLGRVAALVLAFDASPRPGLLPGLAGENAVAEGQGEVAREIL